MEHPIIYSGELYYEGYKDKITVHELIHREDGVGFVFETTWEETGSTWKVDGFAKKDGSSFISQELKAVHVQNTSQNHNTCVVKFEEILPPDEGGFVRIEGVWIENGDKRQSYKFEGDLKVITS